MRTTARILSVAGLLSLTLTSIQQPDRVPEFIREAQQALGGSVLKNVSSIRMSGTRIAREGSYRIESAMEIRYISPRRFAQITTRIVSRTSRGDSRRIEYVGFDGDSPFHFTITPDAADVRSAVLPEPELSRALDQNDAKGSKDTRALILKANQRVFATYMLPLIMDAIDPLQVTFRADGVLDGHVAVRVSDNLGGQWLVLLDGNSHLPRQLRWSEAKAVKETPTSPGQSPTAPRTESNLWVRDLLDYRTEQGVTWPRKLITRVGDRIVEELMLTEVGINGPVPWFRN